MIRISRFFACFFALICMQPVTTKANYAAGGELLYEWLSGSTYRFYFKLYRDCGGNTEPATLPLCFSNSCSSTSFTATMSKYTFPGTPGPIVLPCAGYQTKCYDPSSAIDGVEEVWYYADVTLSAQCNSWKMFVPQTLTRPSTSNLNGSTTMHIEATLNNTGNFQGNSSPYYSSQAFKMGCQNTPFNYNNGCVDPNGDSLVHEVIQPLVAPGSCAGTATASSFTSTTPALSIPANPFQTSGSFLLNQTTGQISFTPTQAGRQTLTIRTKEYRNNVLIGSIMRETTVEVYNCGIPKTPALDIVGNAVNGAVHSCTGQPLNFCFDIKSANPAAQFTVMHAVPGMTSATVTFQNQKTDSVRGCFSWSPTTANAGKYNLVILVTDSSCGFPGLIPMANFNIPIYVWDKVNAQPDTNICAGESVKLRLDAGGIDTWTVLSGDANSLSCTGCSNPTATPTVSSIYEVTLNNLPAGCPVKKDTVVVTVGPVNQPNITIAASPFTNVWPGLNVTFTATTMHCHTPQYQWRINGSSVPGATNATFNTTSLANNDIVTCLLTCSDTCIIDTPSNAITMNVATGVGEIAAASTRLYPNPNNGVFTLSIPAFGGTVDVEITNQLGQVVWSQRGVHISAAKTLEINTGVLPEGHYILKLGDSGRMDVLRFSIQR